jgi:hypothetical protein
MVRVVGKQGWSLRIVFFQVLGDVEAAPNEDVSVLNDWDGFEAAVTYGANVGVVTGLVVVRQSFVFERQFGAPAEWAGTMGGPRSRDVA